MQLRSTALFAGMLASLFLNPSPARAIFHTWDLSEVYSNDDGSVQFIEFAEEQGLDSQNSLSIGTLTTDANTFFFADLPSNQTANKFFLVGTGPSDPAPRAASLALQRLGARRRVELSGGMHEWRAGGLPVESAAGGY